jgi:hypothetical protein
MADADRGIEHYALLQSLMNGERVYPRLVKHFRDAEDSSQPTADGLLDPVQANTII